MDRNQPDEVAELEFHQASHRVYRGAKSYLDACLRDAGHDPATTRICEPGVYGATAMRVFRRLCLRAPAV